MSQANYTKLNANEQHKIEKSNKQFKINKSNKRHKINELDEQYRANTPNEQHGQHKQPRQYKQLTRSERVFIEISLENHHNIRYIADELGRSPSTISREIKRNSKPNQNKTCRVNKTPLCKLDGRNYRGTEFSQAIIQAKEDFRFRKRQFHKKSSRYTERNAQRQAIKRKTEAGRLANPIKLSSPEYADTLKFILDKLHLRWSPEQISLRIKTLNDDHLLSLSPTTIYSFIYSTKNKELIDCLRRRGRKYRRKNPRTVYNQTNRAKHSIHDRPEVVNQLIRIGDLEGDTIVGKDKKDHLLTHTDRITGLTSVSLVKDYNAYKITKQTAKDLERVFGQQGKNGDNEKRNEGNKIVKTITYDNGVEFTFWQDTEKLTDTDIYFADPYTPSQRGRNENANGLIRDFFPKGTDFKKLSKSDILKVEFLLNNRPRKRLGGKTPYEAYVALGVET